MIEAFFFGPRGAIAFYNPSADPGSRELLVVCPPLFDEHQRSYRALSDLANACASHPQGAHVLRINYSGTGEAHGLLSDASVHAWLDDINQAIEEGIALTGADHVVLMGVRFGATLAAQCCHPAVVRYIFWDPIDTGREYLQWIDHINAMLKSKHQNLAKQVNRKLENIPYVCFELSQALRQGFEELAIGELCSKYPDKVWISTTSKQTMESGRYRNCEFSGFEYDWPAFHEGNLTPKPVLESIAKKVLKQ
jgi:hypothetical protein